VVLICKMDLYGGKLFWLENGNLSIERLVNIRTAHRQLHKSSEELLSGFKLFRFV